MGLFIFFPVFANAQTTIKGKVFDVDNKELLPGASVFVTGSTIGTVTDFDGRFTLEVPSSDFQKGSITVTFIGYKKQTVEFKGETLFRIGLVTESSALEEVVITSSYGTARLKQDIVGSIATVKTKDLITEQSVTSIDEMLEGQTAGVLIDASEESGKPVSIQIRGQGTLTPVGSSGSGTSSQPLIIVDGVYLTEEVSIDGNAFFDTDSEDPSNPLSKIGVDNIASINILKDAAAVSIYGADGANGVIIITTKGGHKGKIKTNLRIQSGITTAFNHIDYMSGSEYNEIRNLFYENSGQETNVQPWNGVDTDWYGLLNRNAFYQKYTMSISGGGQSITYRVGAAFQDKKEVQVGNSFRKVSLAAGLNYEKGNFRSSIRMSPSYTLRQAPNTLSNYAVQPNIALYDENGNYQAIDVYGNPVAVANQNVADTRGAGIIGSISANYKILDGLNISGVFGTDYTAKEQDVFRSGLNESGKQSDGTLGYRNIRNRTMTSWNWNARLTYNNSFNKSHNVDVLAGVEAKGSNTFVEYARGNGFENYATPQPIELAEEQDYQDDTSESYGRSFISQANYDFRKKYFLLVNFRIDQSSAFGTDNNTAYNSGIGLSWNITKENINFPSWLKYLKLKTSYGSSGNSRIGSYSSLGLYNVSTSPNGYNSGDYSATPATAPNPDLGWEKNYKFNVGIDFTIDKYLKGTIEYFKDYKSDMIVSRDAIPETGYSTVQINGAEMYNQGIELGVEAKLFSRTNFKWNSRFNISKINNNVTHLEGLGSQYSSAEGARAQRIGYATSIIWGYDFIGIDPATGRNLFNHDGQVVDGATIKNNYNESEFWVPIGNTQPDVFGGFNNSFILFRNVKVGVNMSYNIGGDVLVQKELLDHYNVISTRNLTVNAYNDAWRNPGDQAKLNAVTNSNPIISNSSKYLYSTSHIKLNSVNVSYSMKFDRDNFMESLSVFANGSNLYYFYFEKSPEESNGITELRRMNPEMRTYSFGLTAKF